jgi:uncharacterized protein
MKKSKLPTRDECLKIIKELRVPAHIVKHSMTVAKLAAFLAEKLKEKGIKVNAELVERASMLHDILRVCDFKESDYKRFKQPVTNKEKNKWNQFKNKYQGLCHEDAAYEVLKDKYPELARIIKRHRYTALLDKEAPRTWEEKLVYYADKRVMHDKIVPLKERLQEAHRRHAQQHNPKGHSRIYTTKIDALIFDLEKEIFEKIDLEPVEVTNEMVNPEIR